MTCSSNDSPHTRSSDSLVNFEAANRLSSLHISYSRSDLQSTDYVHVPTNSQLVSHMASYHKRQAFDRNGYNLSTPKTEKFSKDCENGCVRYGLSSMQGWRTTMEDVSMGDKGQMCGGKAS
ncbi:hypothetical protein C1H46_008972 [Malus baccata]|uniref:Uncharacterized protein n=1 Tax=Malus baccata TaxID=106549 RepID=A0A540N2W9_MALBA|nr:hypothetical protein C1H46_008972 [Malus baccata]